MYYIFWISKYATGPTDRLDTIQDHQLFLVALIVFSQSAGSNWDVSATHSGTVQFYPTADEVKNGIQANEYPIVSRTYKDAKFKEYAGSSLGPRGQGANVPWDLPWLCHRKVYTSTNMGMKVLLLRRRRKILYFWVIEVS